MCGEGNIIDTNQVIIDLIGLCYELWIFVENYKAWSEIFFINVETLEWSFLAVIYSF